MFLGAAATMPARDIDRAKTFFRETLEFEVTDWQDFGEMKTVDGIITMPDGSKGDWFKDTEGNIIGLNDGVM